jgi:hypothetical protein
MCRTANLIPRVAANDCDQALLANDSIAYHHDPVWRFACASWRALFHGYTVLTNQSARLQSEICVCCENIRRFARQERFLYAKDRGEASEKHRSPALLLEGPLNGFPDTTNPIL